MILTRLQERDFKMYEITQIWGIGEFCKEKKIWEYLVFLICKYYFPHISAIK